MFSSVCLRIVLSFVDGDYCTNTVHCFYHTLIAFILRAGRSGIESRWRRDFPPVQTGPGTHPASCKMGTGSFPGVKCGRGVLLTTHPLLVPRSWQSTAIPLPILWATAGLQTGSIYLYLFNSVYGALHCALFLVITTPVQKVFCKNK